MSLQIDNHSRAIVSVDYTRVSSVLVNGDAIQSDMRIANSQDFYVRKGDVITITVFDGNRCAFALQRTSSIANANVVGSPDVTTMSIIVCTDTLHCYGVSVSSKSEKSDETILE